MFKSLVFTVQITGWNVILMLTQNEQNATYFVSLLNIKRTRYGALLIHFFIFFLLKNVSQILVGTQYYLHFPQQWRS